MLLPIKQDVAVDDHQIDCPRYVSGETNPDVLPVDAETVIGLGSLVYLADDGTAKPADMMLPCSSSDETRAKFHDVFAGVALQGSPAGCAKPIRVATTGRFKFQCIAGAIPKGHLIGSAPRATCVLWNEVVDMVNDHRLAIGRCVSKDPGSNKVVVDICSVIAGGGVSDSVVVEMTEQVPGANLGMDFSGVETTYEVHRYDQG